MKVKKNKPVNLRKVKLTAFQGETVSKPPENIPRTDEIPIDVDEIAPAFQPKSRLSEPMENEI